MRDTADKVKVAEQIILANDKAKAEVVVDVELLQINTSKLLELGHEPVVEPDRLDDHPGHGDDPTARCASPTSSSSTRTTGC